MMLVFVISVAITIFLLLATLLALVTGEDRTEVRLAQVSAAAPQAASTSLINTTPTTGLGRVAGHITRIFNPIRGIITGTDADLEYKLLLAGFRKPEHMEIFTATKMLLPVIGIVVGTFFPSSLIVALMIGGVVGFFGPDLVLSYLVTRRQEKIRLALPDALDLLVVCMEAGLGIDQAMVRVGDEMDLTAPDLAEEFQIINREQRAGKPRLDAWRSMADRVDSDFVRQFVTMLVQTERFGTPIAVPRPLKRPPPRPA
jgi:tight adherence protein C